MYLSIKILKTRDQRLFVGPFTNSFKIFQDILQISMDTKGSTWRSQVGSSPDLYCLYIKPDS